MLKVKSEFTGPQRKKSKNQSVLEISMKWNQNPLVQFKICKCNNEQFMNI